jgi:hypothetical protein
VLFQQVIPVKALTESTVVTDVVGCPGAFAYAWSVAGL